MACRQGIGLLRIVRGLTVMVRGEVEMCTVVGGGDPVVWAGLDSVRGR